MSGDKKEHRRHKRYGIKSCTVQHKVASFLGLFGRSSEKYLVPRHLSPWIEFYKQKRA